MTKERLIPSVSESFLGATLDALTAQIAILNESGTIVAVNASWRKFAAANGLCSANDCIGLNYLEVCDSATGQDAGDAEAVGQGIRDVLTQKSPQFYFEYPCESPTGMYWFAVRVTPFINAKREWVVIAHENISNRKLAEIALDDKTREFQTILDNVPAYVFYKDTQNVILRANKSATDSLDLPTGAMDGKHTKLFYPDLYEQYYRDDQEVIRSGQPKLGIVEPLAVHDGKTRWLETNKIPIFCADNKVTSILVVAADRTDRQRAEEALQNAHRKLEIKVERRTTALTQANRALAAEIAQRKKSNRSLIRSEKSFQRLADTVPAMIWTSGPDKLCTYLNIPWLKFTGRTLQQGIGNGWAESIHVDDRQRCLATYQGNFDKREKFRMEYRLRHNTGSYRWVMDTGVPNYDTVGHFVGYIGSCIDITDRKVAEDALFQEKERAEVTLASIGDAVVTTNPQGLIESLNPIAEELLGCSGEIAHGRSLRQILDIVDENSGERMDDLLQRCLRDGETDGLAGETLIIRRDDKELSLDDSAAPIRDSTGKIIGAVFIFRDVTDQRSMLRRITHQATHDPLTDLVNRQEFERRLQLLLNRAKKDQTQHALCYLDLDQFKVVNDTCGHIAGDELLRQLTTLLKNKMRERDTLARLGGDEFGVLLGECPLDSARSIAHQLHDTVQGFRFAWQDQVFNLGVSIGLIPITRFSGDHHSVLSAADSACYAAKEGGRNRVHVYQHDDNELAKRQIDMQWVARLQHALDENLFALYYQPIVPLDQNSRKRRHSEILLRMTGKDGVTMTPGSFIPAAERYHKMLSIDRWVVRSAFETLSGLSDKTLDSFYSINISGQSLCSGKFLKFIAEQLKKSGIAPEKICFEITETAAISNLTAAKKFIATLKNTGCRFALDDFGSGLSSFAYLRNLPVDYLKIDGCFVKDMATDSIDFAMVEAIHKVGHLMGIQTIAECVENKATLASLRDIGVDFGQGYEIEKPRALSNGLEP